MLLHGISHVLEDRDQDLLVTPVKLLFVVPAVRKAEEGSGHSYPARAREGLHPEGGKAGSAFEEFSLWGKKIPQEHRPPRLGWADASRAKGTIQGSPSSVLLLEEMG